MKSIADLAKIRSEMQEKLHTRSPQLDSDTQIVVGMGTCGIAAGASKVVNALVSELAIKGIKNAKVVASPCMGICNFEPIVKIIMGDKEVTYINVDEAKAKEIVSEHIVNGKVVDKYLMAK